MDQQKFLTVDQYLAEFSGETRNRMDKIRSKIFELMPNAEESISYNIPAYFIDKKMVVYFAGYEHHVSLYPGRTLSAEHTKLASKYASGKSTLKFLNSKPLPMDLIEQFIELRKQESREE